MYTTIVISAIGNFCFRLIRSGNRAIIRRELQPPLWRHFEFREHVCVCVRVAGENARLMGKIASQPTAMRNRIGEIQQVGR